MPRRMLIDTAHPEETRVVVLNGNRLEEFDFETSTKKQIKGNIYLAKVTRVEPSLQAAFVEYGGNRHGFLAFSEIHPDYYRIPVADRQAALAADRAAEQAADEEEDAEHDAGDDAQPPHFSADSGAADEPAPERMAHEAPAELLRGPVEDAESPTDRFAADETNGSFAAAAAPAETDHAASPPATYGEAGADAGEAHPDTAPGEDGDAPPAIAEATHDHAIETVGGDEIEETTRPRARPFRHYKIQEVIKRRQIMLVQVTKEERGNKGAALTTYLSLAGRYCVLMPNTPRGGGVSRKITNSLDRRRLKDLVSDLDMPEGMGVIVRTAGSERSKTEIKRDFEYLLRLWDEIRDLTLKSTAPALIYEEGNLIKRSIRDLYTRDIDEVMVDGDDGYRTAKAFMKMLMPSHAKRVKPYRDPGVPLFYRFQVESQIDAIHSPVVQLRSGGYIVINPTEALVAIDVNSGRSTKERNIEETALKTNVEAAEEIARQLRLRDLAGLIVIDFIDMEEHRNQATVERRLKEAMRYDRARIQLGRISPFGLLELSRQRLRPSLLEASTMPCPRCAGTGHIRSTESTALHVLRAIEEEGMRRRSAEITVAVPTAVALYILNQKRTTLQQIEARFGIQVTITNDDTLVPPAFRLDRMRALTPAEIAALPAMVAPPLEAEDEDEDDESFEEEAAVAASVEPHDAQPDHADHADHPEQADHSGPADHPEQAEHSEPAGPARGRRRRRRGRSKDDGDGRAAHPAPRAAAAMPAGDRAREPDDGEEAAATAAPRAPAGATHPQAGEPATEGGDNGERKRRRRGRRGGRRRRRGGPDDGAAPNERHENGAIPEAEIVELIPASDAGDEAGIEVEEDFAAAAAPSLGTFATETIPIVERGDMVKPPAAEHEVAAMPNRETRPTLQPDAAMEEEPERAPIQYNAPPTHDVSGPPSNPRRGWWRR